METTAGTQEQVSTAPPERFPRLWVVIVFRLLIVAASAPFLGRALNWVGFDDWLFLGTTVITTAAASLVVALGLIFRQRWAGWLAVIYDAAIAMCLFGVLFADGVRGGYPLSLFISVLAPPVFFLEGLSILQRLSDSRRAASAYQWIAVVILCASVAVPFGQQVLLIRRVRPLVDYADKHWMPMPRSLSDYRDPETGYSVIELERLGGSWSTGDPPLVYSLGVVARDLGHGRWLIPGNPESKDSPLATAVVELFGGAPYGSGSERHEALARAKELGLRDLDLVYGTTTGDLYTMERSQSRRHKDVVFVMPSYLADHPPVLRSPKSRTRYLLSSSERVLIRPERDVVVPEKR